MTGKAHGIVGVDGSVGGAGDRFLDVVTERATAEIEQRWMGRLAGIDVFTEDHVRNALLYVRWDD